MSHLRIILHGRSAQSPDIRAAVGALRDAGHTADVRVTWEAGDAGRYAAEAMADGVEVVVAGGGDGTANSVTAALVKGECDHPPALALLPLGTANDFARAAGIPLGDPDAALRLAAEGEEHPVDVGMVNDRPFLNVATGGFGTRVTVETPELTKKLLGGVAYLLTGLTRFTDIRPERAWLRTSEGEFESDYWAFAFGNGRQAGGGVPLCPEALIDDGLLDVTVLPALAEERRLEVLSGFFSEGRAAIEREVTTFRVAWAELEAKELIRVNLDGEPIHGHRLRIEARPAALRVRLPAGTPLLTPGDRPSPASTMA